MNKILVFLMGLILFSCNGQETKKPLTKNQKMDKQNLEYITFGGGCFWCVESCFNMLKGLDAAIS